MGLTNFTLNYLRVSVCDNVYDCHSAFVIFLTLMHTGEQFLSIFKYCNECYSYFLPRCRILMCLDSIKMLLLCRIFTLYSRLIWTLAWWHDLLCTLYIYRYIQFESSSLTFQIFFLHSHIHSLVNANVFFSVLLELKAYAVIYVLNTFYDSLAFETWVYNFMASKQKISTYFFFTLCIYMFFYLTAAI